MTREEVAKRIREIGVVPVVRAASAKSAQLACEAVCAGGIPIVEVTMTVPGAVPLIEQLAQGIGRELLIGAGTVFDVETARQCLEAGAQFVVSPGVDLETIRYVKGQGTLMMAGALTPTEAITAWKAGSDFVKIFPCGAMGGAKYLRALKAPLPQVPMIPTGGVSLETAGELIRAGAEALGIGGELISAAALASGDPKPITEAARKFVEIVRTTRAELAQSVA